jgi:hypothetical protein
MARQRPCRHWRPTSASVRSGVGCEYYHFLVHVTQNICVVERAVNTIVSFSHAVFLIVTDARYVSFADAGTAPARQGWLRALGSRIARVY